jgi:hypothetical protein
MGCSKPGATDQPTSAMVPASIEVLVIPTSVAPVAVPGPQTSPSVPKLPGPDAAALDAGADALAAVLEVATVGLDAAAAGLDAAAVADGAELDEEVVGLDAAVGEL